MEIDVQLLPLRPDPASLSSRSVVVLDILRATSVIVYALSQGAKEFVPVLSVEEAFKKKGQYPAGSTLLGGEKDTQQIEGFDLGNSPAEYIAEKIKDKRIILRTTNGTQAFHLISSAREVMVGSFFNIEAVARRCIVLGLDLLVFPSGDEGRFSMEDTVCAGMIIDRTMQIMESRTTGRNGVSLTDASQAARFLFKRFENDREEAFRLSHHGKRLIRLGRGGDLPCCARTDIVSIVPVFREGVIRAL